MLDVLPRLDASLKRLEIGERLVRRNPLFYGAARDSIASLQNASLAARMDFTADRLERILGAARTTAYGRALGSPSSFELWPHLQKTQVREDPRAFCSRGVWLKTRANTGGTTGTPLKLQRSAESVVIEQVCIDQMIRALGVGPLEARMAVLRGDNIKSPSDLSPPFWKHTLGGRRLTLSTNHLNDRTLPAFVAALEDFQPDLLWAYPSALESFCRALMRAHRTLRIPRVLTSSEMLQPEVWRLASSLLDCRLIDYYGQAERVAFAYASEPGRYFFLPGYAHIELVKRAGAADVDEYEIVGTSLWNTAMPLVRYCTGDLLRLPSGASTRELREIVYGLRPFSGVIGRSQDVLLAPDGVSVLTGIDHIQRGIDHMLRLQVEQRTLDRVILRVLATPAFGSEQKNRLLANARSKIPESVSIEIEVVDALERTASGKTPFVIHGRSVRDAFRAAGLSEQRS